MNLPVIVHHAYDIFCYPLNEDQLSITLRTGKDVSRVFLIYGDPYCWDKTGETWKWQSHRTEILNFRELETELLWTTTVEPEFKRCKYYFEVQNDSDDETVLVFENGFYTPEEYESHPELSVNFLFPWMNDVDRADPPAWAENTIWYQIFPSRFCHSNKGPSVKGMLPWANSSHKVSNQEIYGGNLWGIIEKLDYLKQIGINGIYLNPVNKATSQHKYDTVDYFEIDPEFGDRDTMQRLVKEAHLRGMKVMLDGVFNHSGWFFPAWQDVIKNREKSEFADWFMVNDWNFDAAPGNNARNRKYFSFAFADYMPKLNTSNPQVRDFILRVCRFWVKDYDIDAIRLDVANEISHKLCQEMRSSLRELKNDFFIVGEIWGNSTPWLRGDQFDSVINYPLRNAIFDFQFRNKDCVKSLEHQVNRCLTNYYEQTTKVLINQMDSHDTARLISKTNGNKEATMQQFAMLMALPGSACIYYGTEILLEGGEDPDCRRCMPWEEIDEGKFDAELDFMTTLIHTRKNHPALRSTDIRFIYSDDDKTGKNRVVHFEKHDTKSGEIISCWFNFGSETITNFLDEEELNSKKILISNCYSENSLQPGGFLFIS